MDQQPTQYSLSRSILLSLLPGLGITIIYIAISPLILAAGLPLLFALMLAALLGVLVFELGFLLVQARRSPAGPSLLAVIDYKKWVPAWQYVAIPLLFFLWGVLVTGIAPRLETRLGETAFAWLPGWLAAFDPNRIAEFSRPAILATFMVGLVVNGLVAPTIEELYFRGHLLARISRYGAWAPAINVVLFSLYHFWSPWQFASRVVLTLPIAYYAQRKRNVMVPIVCHCSINIVGWILTFGLVSSLM
jgi:membrane protease YdiL (CAAX protease family)